MSSHGGREEALELRLVSFGLSVRIVAVVCHCRVKVHQSGLQLGEIKIIDVVVLEQPVLGQLQDRGERVATDRHGICLFERVESDCDVNAGRACVGMLRDRASERLASPVFGERSKSDGRHSRVRRHL